MTGKAQSSVPSGQCEAETAIFPLSGVYCSSEFVSDEDSGLGTSGKWIVWEEQREQGDGSGHCRDGGGGSGLVQQPGQHRLEGIVQPHHLLPPNCCCQCQGLILSAHGNEHQANVF